MFDVARNRRNRSRTAKKPALPAPIPIARKPLPARRWARELGWRHLVLLTAVVFSLFPIVWIVSSSVNAIDTLSAARLVPRQLTTDNFTELFTNDLTPFGRWLWNSWKIAIIAASVNVFLAAMASYAYSRFRFRGRRIGLLTLLLVQIFPQFLAFIALFLLAQQIGAIVPQAGLNTHIFLIMVYLGGALGFNVFLIKGFMDAIPLSLDESAKVDGASAWQIFTRIVLPLSGPVLAAIFVITFINIYSEFILAATLLRSTDQFTLPIGLQLFTQSEYSAKWGNITAATVIGALPVVATFLVAQKQIIGGLIQGAVKG